MATPLRVLMLEDRPADAEVILAELRRVGFAPVGERVTTEGDYLVHLHAGLDVILADDTLPQVGAVQALQIMQARGLELPFIIVGGAGSNERAVACLQQGATDYVLKEHVTRLGQAVIRALRETQARQERQQAEAALRVSQARKAAIMDAAIDGIITIDQAGTIVEFNAAAERLFGLPRTAAIGQPLVELCIPPTFRERHRRGLAHYLATGEGPVLGQRLDMVALRADGTEFPIELSIARVGAETPVLFTGFVRDRSERQRAAATLAQLAAIVTSSDDAIIGTTLEGTIVSWNQGAERLYGYAAAEVIGRSLTLLVPPERAEEMPEMLGHLRRGDRIEPYETVRVRHDGTLVEVSMSISPILDDTGHLTGVSTMARDITERQQTAAALQAKSDELRAMSQQLWQAAKLATLGELAASIAHELNNPLATVSLRIESLLAQAPEDDPRRRALTIIEQEVERMSTLVANLLQFSRRSQPQISSIDVRDELDNTLALIQSHLRNHRITVVRQFAPNVPMLYADRQQLRQVFLNLLANASDAMPQGGTLTVRVATGVLAPAVPAIGIAFIDTGVGIAPEDMPKVMEPFFTTKPEGQGTGLGLPICRRIVHEHRGTLELSSTVGQGTTICLTLPITTTASM
jgi:PAS domain S-box-containing protein